MKNIVNLGNVATYINGYAFKPSDWAEDGTPIIRIQDLTGNSYQMNRFKGIVDSKYDVNSGDVLISWSASLGVYVWNRGNAVLNQHIFKVVFDKEEVDKDFFVFQIDNLLKRAANQAHGATMRHLTKPVFDALPFYLPDIKTQRLISSKLNLIVHLIEDHHEQLKKLDELIRSRFLERFGDPIINPFGYPIHKLGDYIENLTSGARGWARYYADDGNAWFITIKNVKNCKITVDNMQTINAPDNAEAKRTRVKEGDLLISITADLGRTGVVTKEIANKGSYINQHLSCIRLNRYALEPLYVAYFMESEAGKRQFKKENQSAVKAGINFKSIQSLKLMVPPLVRQEEFLSFYKQVDKSKYREAIFLYLLEDVLHML